MIVTASAATSSRFYGNFGWQRRFYPYGVYSEKKRLEKLNYMHNNPVKRGLVRSPGEWPWSSFGFYHLNDSSFLSMDKLV